MIGALLAASIGLATVVACLLRPALFGVVIVAALPFGERVLLTDPVSVQLIDLVAAGVVALTVLTSCTCGGVPLRWPRPALWLVALVFVAMLSTTQSLDVALSVTQLAQLTVGVLLAVSISAWITTDSDRLVVLTAFAVVGSAICLLSLQGTSRIRVVGTASLIDNRVSGIFDQPNNLGGFAAVVLAVGVGLIITRHSRATTVCGVIATIGGLAAIGVSLSRGAMIGAMLALIAIAVLVPAARRTVLGLGLSTVAVAVFAGQAGIGPTPLQNAGDRLATIVTGNDNPYDQRSAIWAEARREIEERPILGFGPNAFPEASARAKSPGVVPGPPRVDGSGTLTSVGADHAHNVLLTIGAETGVFGLAFAVMFACSLGVHLWRRRLQARTRAARAQLATVCGALTAFVGQGLVDFTLRDPVLATTLWVFVGLGLGMLDVRSGRSKARNGRTTGQLAHAKDGG